MRFNELRLAEPIVRAVTAEGYTTPTPIQIKAIPEILAGRDVLGCAQTGTGKTGAFALPILNRLAARSGDQESRNYRGRRTRSRSTGSIPRALVLCPTRELASQIHESFRTYGRNLDLRHAVVFGGVNQARQVRVLQAGVDVLVATPGRLHDLIGQGYIDLSDVEMLVLDEADQMLDMGFIHDIRKVVKLLPSRRQALLFSATMPPEIRLLADSILNDPVFVQVDPVATPVEAITQSVYMVSKKNKPILLARLLGREAMERTLIFTRTKHGADKLVKVLGRSGIEAGAIHGNKSQNARTRTMNGFKAGGMPVLIATDIASRGIDVEEITHVVNFDLPHVAETYVHRIGRTARAGASGVAFSFCDHDELGELQAIEQLIDKRIEVAENEPDLIQAPPTGKHRDQDRQQATRKNGGRSRRRRGPRSGANHAGTTGGGGSPRSSKRAPQHASRRRRA